MSSQICNLSSRDKELLRRTKSEILVYEQKLRTVDWEHEVLFQRFGRVEKERDELYKRFQAAIYDVQQKSGFKNLLLEKRIAAIGGEVEKKDAQLNEILANANLSPAVLGKMNKKMDDILEAKNQSIRDLQQELERLAKMQNDAVRLYEAKLAEYGIASEELGFVARTEKLSLQEVL